MSIGPLSRFVVADMAFEYLLDSASGQVGLRMYPAALFGEIVPQREHLSGIEFGDTKVASWAIDSLVQVRLGDDPAASFFSQGRTMRKGPTTLSLRYKEQRSAADRIVTVLESERGIRCEHVVRWREGERAVWMETVLTNGSAAPVTLEMLSSFSLGGITPFEAGDAPERLRVHRLRSTWSAEGRLETNWAEQLQLERSWSGYGAACERYGQVGSLPVRGFFPFGAVEDTMAKVVWAAQIAWLGSWQMEFYRQDDLLNFSGGLADREFGHWSKTIAPGTAWQTPPALVTTVAGDLDDACERLTASHRLDLAPGEEELPIIFNEYCTSWGNPTHENLIALADRLAGSPTRFLVIDAGWSERTAKNWDQNGDWIVDTKRFPQGLEHTAAEIRGRGLIPGIWFEFEVCSSGTKAWEETAHHLHRDGRPLQVGNRRFWDFRDPWVIDYLSERVIGLLRRCGLGYLKVDYNDSIGIGCDGAESLGEGMRQHLEGVRGFFQKIRRELPDLVIEICASGGHRLEPSMLELGSMASFSDAHLSPEIPLIAANVQRALQPRQSQIWCVLRSTETDQRLAYSLAATFLGRMCLSGDIQAFTKAQWDLALAAQELYRRVAPIIKDGVTHWCSAEHLSYRHPHGHQALLRVARDGRQALAIVHAFAQPLPVVIMELPGGPWQVAAVFGVNHEPPHVTAGHLQVPLDGDFSASVVHLVVAGAAAP